MLALLPAALAPAVVCRRVRCYQEVCMIGAESTDTALSVHAREYLDTGQPMLRVDR